MEGRVIEVAIGSPGGVDPQTPGQVRRTAEQLLIEPVAQPSDGLGDGDRWGRNVKQLGRGQISAAGDQDTGHDPGEQPTRDAESAFPDLERIEPATLEALVVGEDVVRPGAHHTDRHGPYRQP